MKCFYINHKPSSMWENPAQLDSCVNFFTTSRRISTTTTSLIFVVILWYFQTLALTFFFHKSNDHAMFLLRQSTGFQQYSSQFRCDFERQKFLSEFSLPLINFRWNRMIRAMAQWVCGDISWYFVNVTFFIHFFAEKPTLHWLD